MRSSALSAGIALLLLSGCTLQVHMFGKYDCRKAEPQRVEEADTGLTIELPKGIDSAND